LDEVGILEIILPEIIKLKEFRDDPKWHPEEDESGVFSHVIAALRTNKSENPLVNLSILLHDVGKGVTAGVKGNGFNNFHGHAEAGKDIILNISKRLKLTNKQRDEVMFAMLNHMRFHELSKMKPSKVINLIYNEHWETLKAVAFCDDSCRLTSFNQKVWDEAMKTIEDIEKKWGSKVAGNVVKIVDGKRVIELTGLRPSKMVGDIINKVTDIILSKGIKDQKQIDDLIKQVYKELL
jgi:tRNA nucleotidyltransferase/poly(A) polymerase